MAKLHGFQCDRCGAYYEKNKRKNPNDKTGYNVIGFGFVNTAKQIDRYDLCDDCIAELQMWMDKPECYVVEPAESAFGVVVGPDDSEEDGEE